MARRPIVIGEPVLPDKPELGSVSIAPRNPGVASVQRQAFVARRGTSPMEPGFVAHISVDARRLITIGPDHQFWKAGAISSDVPVVGAIVRIQPPADADPEFLKILVERFFKDAAAVKVMPVAPGDHVLVEGDSVSEPLASTQPMREVVYEMVTLARTGNRDLLVDVVEEALCAAGL